MPISMATGLDDYELTDEDRKALCAGADAYLRDRLFESEESGEEGELILTARTDDYFDDGMPFPDPGADPSGTRKVTTRELSTRVEDTCWAGRMVIRSVLAIRETRFSIGINS